MASEISQRLKSAFEAAIAKLNKYRTIMLTSPTYLVATSMDLRAKFEWWSKAGWERDAIVMAESKVSAVWAEFRPPPSVAVATAARFPSIYMQDDIDEDELDMCTTDRVSKAGGNFDELDYWRLEQSRYPHLSRMARKFLMICASSTPSKRCLFQAELFIPRARNRLSQFSLKQSVLLSSWQKYK